MLRSSRSRSRDPYDSFEAKDGYCVIGAGNNKLYRILCKTIGSDALIDDERFMTVKERVKNHAALKPLIEAWTKERPVNTIVDALLMTGVPAAPILRARSGKGFLNKAARNGTTLCKTKPRRSRT
ncbi:MAG: CoA transferase [Deltaproteobacteria bacterium]|nr:CoA transferase [Deltaproteobacteria bacterium]